jgi:hypothetical protein
MRHLLRFGKEAVFNVNVFTRNFFTEDAIHKQDCTSLTYELLSHICKLMASHF